MASDEELSRLAEAALLQEAKRGALRAEMAGPSGWLKPKLPSTNKKFLRNTIKGTLASNQMTDLKRKKVKEIQLEKFEQELKERSKYKRRYLQASTKISRKGATVNPPVKIQEKSIHTITLKDDGLEISCSPQVKKKDVKSIKKQDPKLGRNIKFIKQSKTRFEVT